ncbi:hybrid sensor histidine kinase/response regulator [Pleurocapsa sp. CCALA 161]|uniref:hybrid sensor histidine kinase/response regulator n=1 Tax=Pleurocapsa sp. CCALA 161 TaxID=2107688 RepID=UPI000D0761E1|nr:hybrid sensor histidine kinase/response regulator [Pleurocapsa sp. CCALA 161]PSB11031.1 hybrid sensor histidine kinase/response regulator [Pleurocapsa sp. CCALA 161]
MSLNPDIRDRAYQFFVEEAQELLQILETGLLELRQDHSIPKVHELMRAAHSIKGGAASVELGAIELLAHRLEDFFKALYSDQVDFDLELESLLLQGYDCLSHPLLEQIKVGSFDEEAALLKAEPVFAALEVRLAEALKNADNYLPSSNDLGVDIVASIFEVDIVQALDHLQSVLLAPSNYEPAVELKNTLEMLAGFAELFNLSGFGDIVQTAQAALQLNPQAALAIIQVTLTDCTLATEQVLAGDRQRGGTVSLALIELAQNKVTKVAEADFRDQQTVLAQDHFESTVPVTDEILDPERWSDLADNEALAEDIFGTITDADELPLETDTAPEAAGDALSQIFDLAANQIATETNNVGEAEENSADFHSIWSRVDEQPSVDDNFSQIFDPATEQIPTETNNVLTNQELSSDLAANQALAEIFGTTADEFDEFSEMAIAKSESVVDPQQISDRQAESEISAAIESIANIFDHLPRAEADSLIPAESAPTFAAQDSTGGKKTAQNAAAKLSVRVDLDRLERMNNLVGELTINRNSLALQNEQLQENVSELEQKCWRFREVTKQLRSISDQMLLEARSRIPSTLQDHPTLDHDADTEFDVLELDSYNLLNSALQEVLEEMVQLEESVEDITIFAQQSDRTINSQRQMLGQMRDELMWVRMLPLEQILQRFPRILRDLSSKYHKAVDLKLKGTGVLVDKAVLEKLSDPLLHLVRNAFDHGIEDPQIRTHQGKSATGTIEIQAYYQGNQTVIEVKDDGQGLDLAKITQKGIERSLISPQEAASATQERLFELIFEPGFSTASQVSELSGRGVGMNIVRSQVETLKGKIGVTSLPGSGSTFTLRLPLTLTIAKLLICSLGLTAFAIPADSIEEIIIPTAEQIKLANGQQFLFLKGKLIPIYALPEILSYNCPIPDTDSNSKTFKTIAPPEDWAAPLLLLRRGQQLFALEVVSLLSEQELVIKPYGKAIAPPSYSYGCTILSDGSLIPAFDGSALIGMILGEEQHPIITSSYTPAVIAAQSVQIDPAAPSMIATAATDQLTTVKTIMIVDDSTALRRTMALTLEKEGYRVVQKKDGKEALNGFKQHPEIDLIICDVEMPVMNGFEFLGMRRRDSTLAQVPTFMLTSRSGAKHRNLAKQLGADGYFTKPYVEQDFIQEVKKILEGKKHSENKQNKTQAIAIKTKTILIVDDSSALRSTLASSLEQKGYRVLQGRDGAEGLNQLRSNLQTDLVICDLEMPNVNGFEFLTLRRQESQLCQVPVVMLTSRGTEKHRNLAASLGASGFFTKPYIEDKFISEIEQYLRS